MTMLLSMEARDIRLKIGNRGYLMFLQVRENRY